MAEFTPAQISEAIGALQSALASGELTVEYAGRRITYRDTDSIIKALAYFTALGNAAAPGEAVAIARSRVTYAGYERD